MSRSRAGRGPLLLSPRRASGWRSLLLASRACVLMGVMAWGRSQNLSVGWGPDHPAGVPGAPGPARGALPTTYVRTGPGTWPSFRWSGHTGACRCPCAFPLQPLLPEIWFTTVSCPRRWPSSPRAAEPSPFSAALCRRTRLLSAARGLKHIAWPMTAYPAVCPPLRCGSFLMSGLLVAWPWAPGPGLLGHHCPRPSPAALSCGSWVINHF